MFWDIAIPTNPKPTIYRNLYENTGTYSAMEHPFGSIITLQKQNIFSKLSLSFSSVDYRRDTSVPSGVI